ncbi:MAG: glycerophosphodiester phosphodiesterase [Deltaproteobacteria bacterium]|nr:glycerophosphodiester phosphodiesterase [Deltaproteobacteria bacterium]
MNNITCGRERWGRRETSGEGRWFPPRRVQIYAHRANRGLWPEHSLPAYAAALKMGCDYVDMDVNLTRDGVLVVTHDQVLNPDLTRNAAGAWITASPPLHTLSYAEVRRYNVGKIKPGTDYARLFPQQQALDFAAIPTLREVVRCVKGLAGDRVGFQIEIKHDPRRPQLSAGPREYAERLYTLLREEELVAQVEVQAFAWVCLLELRKLAPAVKTMFLTASAVEIPEALEAGVRTAGSRPKDFVGSLPGMIKSLKGYGWGPWQVDLTRESLDEAHRLGLKVVPWGWPEKEGCDFNREVVARLIDWGVDGLVTDRADLLREMLAARGYDIPSGIVSPSG